MGRLLIQFAGTNTTKALSETLPKNTIIVDEDLHQLRLHDGTTAGGHIIGGSGGGGVPVGTIIPFAGNSIPEGYLLCDGSAISRTDYATLFAVIGTIYGTGDGNSTFNLPTQSILPHGRQATVVRKSNADVWIAYTASTNSGARASYSTGTYAKMQISTQSRLANKYQTSSGFSDELLSLDPNGGLLVDLTQATGAQGIVCIKY